MARNGVDSDGGRSGEKPLDFLSNQPIEGEALSRKFVGSGLGLEQALQYAIEIGAILKMAHSAGRFHGSLSPASIIITGAAARLLKPSGAPGAEGAEFCPPEQLRGEAPDCGSDVFAFGALLRWLIARTGVDAAAEPIERLIAALTEPDPRHRRRQIRHAVLELRLARSQLRCAASARNHPAPAARKSPNAAGVAFFPANELWRRLAGIAGIALFLVAASAIGAVLFLDHEPVSRAFKFTIVPPEHAEYMGAPAVSPDGARVVFSAIAMDGRRMLWLRSLDALQTLVIPGTEDGSAPFWSPDSSAIGFFASGSLRKVGIAGEPPETICSAETATGGGAWSGDGTILFALGPTGGLYRVSAAGGSPERVLNPDAAKGERAYMWPEFLPDGQHFLFFDRTDTAESTGVYVGALSEPEHRMLVGSESNAVFAASAGGESRGKGYLLFSKEGSLMSRAFSESRLRLEGDPVTLADDIGTFDSLSPMPVSVSNNGVLAYQSAGRRTRQLAWVDRKGRILSFVGGPADYGTPRISSDGRRITVEKLGPGGTHAETLMLDAEGKAAPNTDVPSGLSNENPGDVGVVSPDGKWLASASPDSGAAEIYLQPYGMPANGKSRRQISAGGGYSPRWRRDQTEIYYLSTSGDLMAVTLRLAEGSPEFDGAQALFRTRQVSKTRNSFDVSPDGQSFLMNLPLEDATSSPITVVTNWSGKLN